MDDDNKCYCGKESDGKHSCPKAAELGDNHDEEYCNCCSDCTENCAMEI